MHVLATNICMWLRTLTHQTLEAHLRENLKLDKIQAMTATNASAVNKTGK